MASARVRGGGRAVYGSRARGRFGAGAVVHGRAHASRRIRASGMWDAGRDGCCVGIRAFCDVVLRGLAAW